MDIRDGGRTPVSISQVSTKPFGKDAFFRTRIHHLAQISCLRDSNGGGVAALARNHAVFGILDARCRERKIPPSGREFFTSHLGDLHHLAKIAKTYRDHNVTIGRPGERRPLHNESIASAPTLNLLKVSILITLANKSCCKLNVK